MENVRERLLDSLTLELRRNEKPRFWPTLFAVLALVWALLLFIAPMLEPPNTIYLGNEGKVNIMDNTPYIEENVHNPLARAVYISGDFMCHQHADRSFFINGNQMPYCARCTGMFLGIAFGALIGAFFRVRIGILLYFIVIIPMGLDGVIQLVTSYESTNFIRIVTGMLTGTFTSLVFYYIYHDVQEAPSRR